MDNINILEVETMRKTAVKKLEELQADLKKDPSNIDILCNINMYKGILFACDFLLN